MAHHTTPRTVDAVVIGAGFGGIYSVHKLANELGLTVVGFDKADGPGGTWYWNRYPGALSDTESHLYRYSFDRDLLQDGSWKSTYITQPEILEYLESVVERFDLGRHFRFGTAVESAIYLDDEGQWEVTTDDGAVYRATYVINAVGLLSAINFPNLPGLETFEGDTIHTAAWPEGKDLTGRRVGVIGTGSTGQQVITALAPEVEHLTVFVRTPQYSVPVGNRPVTTTQIDAVKADYDQIWAQVKRSAVAFGFEESTVPAMSVSEEERRRIFEEAWQHGGGFRFMFGTFGDIATDEEANEAAASFIRSKIAAIIEDPETARKLTPTGMFAKRPLCDDGYHAVFNRPNVEAVAIKENPIREVTANGCGDRGRCAARAGRAGLRHRLRRRGRQLPAHRDPRPRRPPHQRPLGRAADQLPGRHHDELPQLVHGAGPQRPVHEPAADHRDPGRMDQRHNRFRRTQRRAIDRAHARGRGRMDRDLHPGGQRDVVHQGQLVDLRRERPREETQRLVLPGWPRQLPRCSGRRHGRRIPRLRRESRPTRSPPDAGAAAVLPPT